MSESSSDTESSCGWTVISNEGSDIETLGPDNAGECEDRAVSRAPDIPGDERVEESLRETSLDLTLREETTTEEAPAQKAGDDVGGEEHVILCSSSENSDILTLPDSCEAEIDPWKEPVVKEAKEAGSDEFYLGSSSSSQYTFRESETIFMTFALVEMILFLRSGSRLVLEWMGIFQDTVGIWQPASQLSLSLRCSAMGV